MSAAWLMVGASLLFAMMGVGVKFASAQYGAGEIVFYRALVGAGFTAAVATLRGTSLRTSVPSMHFWRSTSGVLALLLWFQAIAGLPLATAMTLNYMSSVWMALFLIGGSVWMGASRVDGRLVAAVLAGFAGVALVLRPTLDQQQLWHGLAGLLSGMLAAMAYLQVTALGRAGEPADRIVFYFSIGGLLLGALWMAWHGATPHTPRGLALLLGIGLLATLAQMMMTRAYHVGRTLANASLQYLGIAFAFAFGVLIFGDPVTASALAGMALIVGAGLVATLLRTQGRRDTADTRTPPNDT
ncbi:MAG TPA: DMT family transporter [Burkholderiaceae bacterium]|nr:DMT family transporter [Burkholderiaceae bacterium]